MRSGLGDPEEPSRRADRSASSDSATVTISGARGHGGELQTDPGARLDREEGDGEEDRLVEHEEGKRRLPDAARQGRPKRPTPSAARARAQAFALNSTVIDTASNE